MGVTNEFERDLNDTSFLHRPGRIDMRVFQNTADAGDGHPGLQRAFRNYLHEGGMEKDLDVNSFDVKNVIDIELTGEIIFPSATIHSSGAEIHLHPNTGNEDGNLIIHPYGSNTGSHLHLRNDISANHGIFSVKIDGSTASLFSEAGGAGTPPDTLNMNDANWDNINIGDTSASVLISGVTMNNGGISMGGNIVISGTVDGVDISAWIDQDVRVAASPTFAGVSLTGDLALVANSITGTSVDINNAEMQQLSNIGAATISGTQWGYLGNMDQAVHQSQSPTFAGLSLGSGNLNTVANIYLTDNIIHVGDTNTSIDFDTDQIRLYTGGNEILDLNNSGLEIGGTGQRVTHIENSITNTSTRLVSSAGVYVHSSSTSNPHSVSADQAFDQNQTVETAGPINFYNCDNNTKPFRIGDGIIEAIHMWANGNEGYITLSTTTPATHINLHRPSSANDAAIVRIYRTSGDHNKVLQLTGGTSGNEWVAKFINASLGSDKKFLDLTYSADSSLGTTDHWIEFNDSGGLVGRVHSEVQYATFTGSHDSQTEDDISNFENGMIFSSTGKMIGKHRMSRALVKTKLTIKKQDKAVFGVLSGITKPGHNFKGFNKKKEVLSLNALGEGMILVTDTNGNIAIGDYIQSSGLPGLGEKQNDDILHNYTVAKATKAINWNRIKAKNGIKKKLISCTYHCG